MASNNFDKNEIVSLLRKFFNVKELVDDTTYSNFGENSWRFLDVRALHTLFVLRTEILKVPLVINDWSFGGKNKQRGLRTNLSPLVVDKTKKGKLYLTAHCFGKAFDVVSAKMSADEMRRLIIEKAYLLPYPIRIEDGSSAPTWLHFDTMTNSEQNKIEKFY